LGANTPAAVSSLIKGCRAVSEAAALATVRSTVDDEENAGANASTNAAAATALASIHAIASLSDRERSRAATMFRFTPASLKSPPTSRLEFELALDHGDPLAVALFVDENLRYRTNQSDDSVEDLLRDEIDLQVRALQCLAGDIAFHQTSKVSPGRMKWILPAYLRVLAIGRKAKSVSFQWVLNLAESLPIDVQQSNLYRTLVSIAWVGLAQSLESCDMERSEGNIQTCEKAIRLLLDQRGRVQASFGALLVETWKSRDPERLGSILVESMGLTPSIVVAEGVVSSNSLVPCCDRLVEVIAATKYLEGSLHRDDVLRDPQSAAKLLLFMKNSAGIVEDQIKETLGVLLEPGSDSAQFISTEGAWEFVSTACNALANRGAKENDVPVVLPLQLERVGLEVFPFLSMIRAPTLSKDVASFLLKLAYSIRFSHDRPESPFLVDLRQLPVREIWTLLQAIPDDAIDIKLRAGVIDGLQQRVPEAAFQVHLSRVLKNLYKEEERLLPVALKEKLSRQLLESLRNAPSDPHGEKVERLFRRAYGNVRLDVLCCTVASVALSTGSPLTFFPFSRLYMDPLVMLKCPLAHWDRDGIRRSMLAVFCILVDLNDALLGAASVSRDDDTSSELRVARNVLIIRCILALMKSSVSMRSCFLTVAFVRRLVSGNFGIGAAVLRQGVDDSELDWLIEFVPELMDDGKAYHNLLAMPTLSIASERLVAAGGVLRICIMHGHRNESRTQALALAAVTQFIASFFMALGPVGLPAQTLVGYSKGSDAVTVCRNATLRMIRSTVYVRGQRQGLRNECVVALQKLARLCKGEELVGGLQVSVASRQKGFLREMIDAINKALVAMGSAV
jgi:hypothetical protein